MQRPASSEAYLATVLLLCGCPSLDAEVVAGSSGDGETGSVSTSTGGPEEEEEEEDEQEQDPPPPTDGTVAPAKSFFVGESLNFSGGGACTNSNLNDVTTTLVKELEDNGWTGSHYVDEQSWPEDFADAELFPMVGLDHIHGDNASLSVYAGHGNVNLWQWGTPSDSGACVLTMNSSVRLGTLAGDRATVVMSLTSCTGMATQLWPTFGQTSRVRQILAYHNSPAIWANQPRKFFRATADGMSNRRAWLSVMASKPGLGHNSPSLLTLGVSASDALAFHSAAQLGTETAISAPPEDANHYAISYLDYGCGPCGCPAQDLGATPWLDLQTAASEVGAQQVVSASNQVPTLRLERIDRSPSELVTRVTSVLELADVGAIPAQTLTDWAGEVIAGSDTTTSFRIDNPKLTAWVLYTPRDDDMLVVVDHHESTGSFDLTQASARFRQLVLGAEMKGLATGLALHDPRVGYLVTHVGAQPDKPLIHEAIEGWSFAVNQGHAGFAVLDAGLSATIGVNGRPLMVRLLGVSLKEIGTVETQSSAALLSQAWLDAIDSFHEAPDSIMIESMQWAYLLDPTQHSAVVAPRLIISYVLGYDGPEGRIPSRQNILSLPTTPTLAPTLLLP